jgi:hypothetical protein
VGHAARRRVDNRAVTANRPMSFLPVAPPLLRPPRGAAAPPGQQPREGRTRAPPHRWWPAQPLRRPLSVRSRNRSPGQVRASSKPMPWRMTTSTSRASRRVAFADASPAHAAPGRRGRGPARGGVEGGGVDLTDLGPDERRARATDRSQGASGMRGPSAAWNERPMMSSRESVQIRRLPSERRAVTLGSLGAF